MGLVHSYPVKDKSADKVIDCIRHFCGGRKAFEMYSDNSKDIMAATKALQAQRQGSQPGVPQNNAIA